MCGIAGIIKKNSDVLREELNPMLDAIAHRGPDGEGTFLAGNIGLGHRRLSIIDLAGGSQPMTDEEGVITIVFNGEIYNYEELKLNLRDMGYSFHTHSDTEVLLYAYKAWGKDCLPRLRGMFAFAVYDAHAHSVLLARDYLGIKPCFYYRTNDMFVFASEIGAIQALPSFRAQISLQALDQYLWMQYIPAPLTIYQDMYKLLPGHYMVVNSEGEAEDHAYSRFVFQEDASIIEAGEAFERLDAVLEDSVRRHMIADIDYGAFLSGGIDSSLIVEYMTGILDRPVKTFSIHFDNDGYSEKEYSDYVAAKLGTEHFAKKIGSDALKILPDLVKHFGEPYGDSSAVPTYYVSHVASEHVKMVLSGDGADELFAGYERYDRYLCRYLTGGVSNGISKIAARESLRNLKYFLKRNSSYYSSGMPASMKKWLNTVQFIDGRTRESLWKPEFREYVQTEPCGYYSLALEGADLPHINRAQFFDMYTYLPNDILTKVDIASMMCSIESRTPFVDREVISLAMQMPNRLNWKRDSAYGYQGKQLLKMILGKRGYPDSFLYRIKRGFSMPMKRWLSDETNVAYRMKMELLSDDALINSFFTKDGIRNQVLYGRPGNVWLLMFLEEWLRQNTDAL